MNNPYSNSSSPVWFLFSGTLSIIAGMVAIALPSLTAIAITQVIGVICMVSGIFLLLTAIFSKSRDHRFLDFISALLRLAVGIMLVVKVGPAVLALTLLLAAVFLAEGFASIVFSFKLKASNPGWVWVLLNGLAALVLGGLLLAKFPSDAAWAIGLLFGINSLFLGVSLIMFGLGLRRRA